MSLKSKALFLGMAILAYNIGAIFLTFTTPQNFYLSPAEGTIAGKISEPLSLTLLVITTAILFFAFIMKVRSKNAKK